MVFLLYVEFYPKRAIGCEGVRKWFLNMPLVRKIWLMFVVGMLIPGAIFVLFFLRNTVSGYHNRIVEDNASMLSMAAQSIESNMALVENVIDILAYDTNVLSLLSNRRLSPYDRLMLQIMDVGKVVSNAQAFISSLDGEIILFAREAELLTSYWRYFGIEKAEEMPDYQRYLASGKNAAWTGISPMRPESTILQSSDNKNLFTYFHDISPGFGSVGCVKCGVSTHKLFSVVNQWEGDGILGVWLEDTLAYGESPYPDIYSQLDRTQKVQRYEDQLVLTRALGDGTISLVLCVNSTLLNRQALQSSMPQIVIGITMGLLLATLVSLLLRNVCGRIKQSVDFAQQAKVSSMDIVFPDMGDDEVGQLVDAFNALLQRLQAAAHDRIAREKNEKTALLLALQYQINPHFLFNTLNWIQLSMELGEDSGCLIEAIGCLGKILRYNLKGESTATLSEEIENTRQYVRLMNLRKNGLITLEVNVDGLPQDMPLLRFVFQPVIENAIQHGMYPGERLTIVIEGYARDDRICFAVKNDGRGISEEKLALLQIDINQARTGKGIGLANIAARLRLFYGEATVFSVDSQQRSTQISFGFPADAAPYAVGDLFEETEEIYATAGRG